MAQGQIGWDSMGTIHMHICGEKVMIPNSHIVLWTMRCCEQAGGDPARLETFIQNPTDFVAFRQMLLNDADEISE